MPIIYNRHFPFGTFYAINICGLIFCRSDKGKMSRTDKNHEDIHTMQQKEMLFAGFYLWYVMEWAVRFLMLRNALKAYHNVSFEREAYGNQNNLLYGKTRRHYAWMKHLKNAAKTKNCKAQ